MPDGFATTAAAYWHFLEKTKLKALIDDMLAGLDVADIHELQKRSAKIRDAIISAKLPQDLELEIRERAYRQLSAATAERVAVAVRSSATAEDLPDASFAGQQETYPERARAQALLEACRRCFASLFTDRAISYRVDKGFDHMKVALSIGVQRMVRSDLATSGVMFSIDTETGFRDAVLINAAYGLGENVVQGSVNPDEYYVFKPTLQAGLPADPAEDRRHQGDSSWSTTSAAAMTKNVPVSPADRAALPSATTRFSPSRAGPA